MKVKVSELRDMVARGVEQLGFVGTDAQTIVDVLLYAQLRGNNQGIAKIATGGIGKAAEVRPYEEIARAKCGAVISGGHAMVSTTRAADLAVELARSHGVGIVGANQQFTSSGAIGFYARRIAEQGYIALVTVGSQPFVTPFGSSEPKLGTNPFSYAIPTRSVPLVFDMTTSAIAFYGVVEAKLKGESLPEGVAFDADGNPTRDPAAALDGSVATFAGHKGFGLSLFVQMMSGPFVGARARESVAIEVGESGAFVMAIDPGLLVETEVFLDNADAFLSDVRDAKPSSSDVTVQLPGERGDKRAATAEQSNEIEIADGVWNELLSFVG